MKVYLLIIVLVIAVFQACNCHRPMMNKTKKVSTSNLLEQKAKSKYINRYKISNNETEDYSLVYKRFKEQSASIPDVAFFIYSEAAKNIIFEDTLLAGDVYWLNDYQVQAMQRGQQAESSRTLYTYDVKLKQIINDAGQ